MPSQFPCLKKPRLLQAQTSQNEGLGHTTRENMEARGSAAEGESNPECAVEKRGIGVNCGLETTAEEKAMFCFTKLPLVSSFRKGGPWNPRRTSPRSHVKTWI